MGDSHTKPAGLDIAELEKSVRIYFPKGLAPLTQRTYESAQDRYLKFCALSATSPLPIGESQLCSYVSFLANEGLKHRTIKSYLSATRHLQISEGLGDPFHGISMPKLEYVLRGVKKHQAETMGGQREWLPITPHLLRQIKRVWDKSGDSRDIKMLWAACCLCFFAFLRAGEMSVPSDQAYDPAVHLSMGDVAVDDPCNPSTLQIKIKQSKTDPFRRGVNLFVGRTGLDLCPVAALLSYLSVRGSQPGPLFLFEDGRFLTRGRFVDAVRTALNSAGVDQQKYCGHSFRIGAATTAAARGIEDSVIKTLGRWESVAYLQYVRIPREQLSGLLVS